MTLLTVELFSLSNGSNILFWNSMLMPIPVSLITNESAEYPAGAPGFLETNSLTRPPGGVYLTALLRRFRRSCIIRSLSHRTNSGTFFEMLVS